MTEENDAPDESYYERHPFIKDKGVIVTDEVEAVYEDIERALTFRFTGLSYQKLPRFGKTRLIMALEKFLRENKPTVYTCILSANAHEKNVQSQRAQFGDVLTSMGHPGAMAKRTEDRRNSAIIKVQTESNKLGCDSVIFFIDEGQNWNMTFWGHWKDFVNQLALHRDRPVHVLTVTFAQPEIKHIVNQLKVERPDLYYRFFLQHIELRGLEEKEQLGFVFEQFDSASKLEFPKGSGISYSSYLMPKAYASGWRLQHELDCAWAAIGPESGKSSKQQIAMASVVQVLKQFFLSRIALDSAAFKGREKAPWELAAASNIFRDLQQ